MSAGNGISLARAAVIAVIAVALAGCAPGTPAPPDDPPPASSTPTPEAEAGWAVHDFWLVTNNRPQTIDGVSCDSPFGPWHLTLGGDLEEFDLVSIDAFYEMTIDPATLTGPVTGTEHSVTTGGDTYDGGSTGTATLTEEKDGYLIHFELDYNVIWSSTNVVIMPGQENLAGHITREASITPATEEDCG
ncbi:MAG: hypothetical protein ABL886_04610 [Rhodoglobus sp.]